MNTATGTKSNGALVKGITFGIFNINSLRAGRGGTVNNDRSLSRRNYSFRQGDATRRNGNVFAGIAALIQNSALINGTVPCNINDIAHCVGSDSGCVVAFLFAQNRINRRGKLAVVVNVVFRGVSRGEQLTVDGNGSGRTRERKSCAFIETVDCNNFCRTGENKRYAVGITRDGVRCTTQSKCTIAGCRYDCITYIDSSSVSDTGNRNNAVCIAGSLRRDRNQTGIRKSDSHAVNLRDIIEVTGDCAIAESNIGDNTVCVSIESNAVSDRARFRNREHFAVNCVAYGTGDLCFFSRDRRSLLPDNDSICYRQTADSVARISYRVTFRRRNYCHVADSDAAVSHERNRFIRSRSAKTNFLAGITNRSVGTAEYERNARRVYSDIAFNQSPLLRAFSNRNTNTAVAGVGDAVDCRGGGEHISDSTAQNKRARIRRDDKRTALESTFIYRVFAYATCVISKSNSDSRRCAVRRYRNRTFSQGE